MKRRGIVVLLRIVIVTAALALSLVTRPQSASAGWTWDEGAAVMTWTDDGSPADDCSAGDGWTWDEGTGPGTDGWTWDEEACGPAPGPAPPAPAPAPSDQPAP